MQWKPFATAHAESLAHGPEVPELEPALPARPLEPPGLAPPLASLPPVPHATPTQGSHVGPTHGSLSQPASAPSRAAESAHPEANRSALRRQKVSMQKLRVA